MFHLAEEEKRKGASILFFFLRVAGSVVQVCPSYAAFYHFRLPMHGM